MEEILNQDIENKLEELTILLNTVINALGLLIQFNRADGTAKVGLKVGTNGTSAGILGDLVQQMQVIKQKTTASPKILDSNGNLILTR